MFAVENSTEKDQFCVNIFEPYGPYSLPVYEDMHDTTIKRATWGY